MTAAEFREARHRLGLSAQAMAEFLGVSSGRVIRRWESGASAVPGPAAKAVRYALAYGLLE